MTTFRYPLPESEPNNDWGGFSDEAKIALTHPAMGPSPSEQLLTPDGTKVEGLSAEALSWAGVELDNDFTDGALGVWQRYENHLGVPVPRSLEDLAQTHPNLAPALTRLHEAKQALIASNEITPEGLNIGETMHLVLVPWQAFFKYNRANLSDWISRLRAIQGILTRDLINDVLADITQNRPLYRDADNPSRLRTSADYLTQKIATDGPWGIMLAQTSDQAGLKRIVEGLDTYRSPDAMTINGTRHFEVAGQTVDCLGIYEWLALTLQEDPRKLLTRDYSWLLANRMYVGGYPCVPYGNWNDGRVISSLGWADYQSERVRVRLAVM